MFFMISHYGMPLFRWIYALYGKSITFPVNALFTQQKLFYQFRTSAFGKKSHIINLDPPFYIHAYTLTVREKKACSHEIICRAAHVKSYFTPKSEWLQ